MPATNPELSPPSPSTPTFPPNPHGELVLRVQYLANQLKRTNLSASSLIACNRGLDAVDELVRENLREDADAAYRQNAKNVLALRRETPILRSEFSLKSVSSSAEEASSSTLTPRIRRLKRASTDFGNSPPQRPVRNPGRGFTFHSSAPSTPARNAEPGRTSHRPLKSDVDKDTVVQTVDALQEKVGYLVSELKLRAEENRHIQSLALSKAKVAAKELSQMRKQVLALTEAQAQSESELRLLESSVSLLKERVEHFRAKAETWETETVDKDNTIQRWGAGVRAWLGNWEEVERRVERRGRELERVAEGGFSGRNSVGSMSSESEFNVGLLRRKKVGEESEDEWVDVQDNYH